MAQDVSQYAGSLNSYIRHAIRVNGVSMEGRWDETPFRLFV
jgi:hypothetical protein